MDASTDTEARSSDRDFESIRAPLWAGSDAARPLQSSWFMHVQLITLEIDTLRNNGDSVAKIILGHEDLTQITENEYIAKQVALLDSALYKYRAITIYDNQPKNCLPVFLVPEFYFRFSPGRPYFNKTFNVGLEKLLALSEKYPEVLIVAGTIWMTDDDPKQWNNKKKINVNNSAFIFYRGKLVWTLKKASLSAIDGLAKLMEIWDRSMMHYVSSSGKSMNYHFELECAKYVGADLKIGVEVCLDHAGLDKDGLQWIKEHGGEPGDKTRPGGLLREEYDKVDEKRELAGVDLHILISAGMRMKKESVVARDGGLFLWCDGSFQESGAWKIARAGTNVITQPSRVLRLWNPTKTPIQVRGKDSMGSSSNIVVYEPQSL